MKIWQLSFDFNNYANLQAIPPLTADEIQSFNGSKKLASWSPRRVKPIETELELGDAPGFTIPVFSQKACDVLMPLIEQDVELLPLLSSKGTFFGVNVTNVLDVIDYDNSIFRRFSDGKRIMAFQKYSFRVCDALNRCNIFKIIDEPTRKAFVSDRVKVAIEENNLKGFSLRLVWDNEEMNS